MVSCSSSTNHSRTTTFLQPDPFLFRPSSVRGIGVIEDQNDPPVGSETFAVGRHVKVSFFVFREYPGPVTRLRSRSERTKL